MDLTYFNDPVTPMTIRQRISDLIFSLKRRRLWKYLDPPTKGWLELASRLKGIKFRSRKVLSVLMSILARLKPLLRLTNLFRFVGLSGAWRNSVLAESWGNVSARAWRSDPVYQFYCGLVEVQVSRIIPGSPLSAVSLAPPMRGLLTRILRRVV